MVYYAYFSLFLVLLKGRYELFSPVDSLWTGRELLLYNLDLPRVDHLFAFTETEEHTTHQTPKIVCREYQSIQIHSFRRQPHQELVCTRQTCQQGRILSNINGGNVARHVTKLNFGTPAYNIQCDTINVLINYLQYIKTLHDFMQLVCVFYHSATHSSAPTPSQLNMGYKT